MFSLLRRLALIIMVISRLPKSLLIWQKMLDAMPSNSKSEMLILSILRNSLTLPGKARGGRLSGIRSRALSSARPSLISSMPIAKKRTSNGLLRPGTPTV